MIKKILSFSLSLTLISLNIYIPSSYAAEAVELTDEELDQVYAQGLNFNFGDFLGSKGNTASQFSKGTALNQGQSKNVNITNSNNSVKILTPPKPVVSPPTKESNSNANSNVNHFQQSTDLSSLPPAESLTIKDMAKVANQGVNSESLNNQPSNPMDAVNTGVSQTNPNPLNNPNGSQATPNNIIENVLPVTPQNQTTVNKNEVNSGIISPLTNSNAFGLENIETQNVTILSNPPASTVLENTIQNQEISDLVINNASSTPMTPADINNITENTNPMNSANVGESNPVVSQQTESNNPNPQNINSNPILTENLWNQEPSDLPDAQLVLISPTPNQQLIDTTGNSQTSDHLVVNNLNPTTPSQTPMDLVTNNNSDMIQGQGSSAQTSEPQMAFFATPINNDSSSNGTNGFTADTSNQVSFPILDSGNPLNMNTEPASNQSQAGPMNDSSVVLTQNFNNPEPVIANQGPVNPQSDFSEPVNNATTSSSTPATIETVSPTQAPIQLDVIASDDGQFQVAVSNNFNPRENIPNAPNPPDVGVNPTEFFSVSNGGINIVDVSDASQQFLSALVNVNAAGSVVPIMLNITVIFNSNVNLSNRNDLHLSNFNTFQVR